MKLLVLHPGTPSERRYAVVTGTTVGRADDAGIAVSDRSLSRHHARIDIEGADAVVKDLGSKNGTWVNGMRVGRAVVHPGDDLRFGDVRARFVDEGAMAAPQPSLFKPMPEISGLTRAQGTNSGDRLRNLLEVSRLLSSPMPLDTLLSKIVDLTFELLDVDRAALLLEDPFGRLQPRVSRSRGKADGPVYSHAIVEWARARRVAAVFDDAMSDDRLAPTQSIAAQHIRSCLVAPLELRDEVLGVLYADGVTPGRYGEADLDFLAAFASQAAVAIGNERLWRRIEQDAVVRNTLLRFFPPSTAAKVLEGGSMAPTETEVTALFCDITGYTALSASLTPMQVLEMLNAYFPAVAEVVFAHGGTLEKYVGDALLAVWGAPFAQADDADRAIQAAIAMQKAVDELVSGPEWKFPKVKVHIGLHTGRVAAGSLGSDRYLQYATVGDATNMASRVCGTAGPGEIVASDSTWSRLGRRPPAARLEDVQVKGRDLPLVLWRLHAS